MPNPRFLAPQLPIACAQDCICSIRCMICYCLKNISIFSTYELTLFTCSFVSRSHHQIFLLLHLCRLSLPGLLLLYHELLNSPSSNHNNPCSLFISDHDTSSDEGANAGRECVVSCSSERRGACSAYNLLENHSQHLHTHSIPTSARVRV